jgi:hypothetical protein
MTVVIDLGPAEEARLLAAAQREGLDPSDLVRKLVREHLPPLSDSGLIEDPAIALFELWDREDAGMTNDEVAEENRQWEELKANINAERDRAGARRVF